MYQLATLIAVATLLPTSQRDAATAHPSCAVENLAAGIREPVAPEFPDAAKLTEGTGDTVIRIDLSDSGKLLNSYVHVSSGSRIRDMAALWAAQQTAYTPELRSCTSIAGSYAVDFHVDADE